MWGTTAGANINYRKSERENCDGWRNHCHHLSSFPFSTQNINTQPIVAYLYILVFSYAIKNAFGMQHNQKQLQTMLMSQCLAFLRVWNITMMFMLGMDLDIEWRSDLCIHYSWEPIQTHHLLLLKIIMSWHYFHIGNSHTDKMMIATEIFTNICYSMFS